MSEFYDARDTRDPAAREGDLFARLPGVIEAALRAPGWQKHLGHVDPAGVTGRAALARLPVLRKSDLPRLQKESPPFGGFLPDGTHGLPHLFTSPGPIYEPEGAGADPWRAARGLHAIGLRPGDVVLNTFSYHLTPGGFIMDSGARALGCSVIPAGPGNTEAQLDLIETLRPVAYAGTPDFLKILLDAAAEKGRDASSITKAVVSGAAFPKSLQAELASRGVVARQAYATADIGFIAYETPAGEGMVVNEDVILEIVGPDGLPVAPGEVGEIVVTTLEPRHPVIRLALGDLTAALLAPSPCGRTASRIKGWMGRADQTTKVKGMFVRPEQVAEIARRHPEVGKARLVVRRAGESDAMTLNAEAAQATPALKQALEESVRAVLKLRGEVALVAPGSLPDDGKVIADERPVG
ncbi:phenylacetate--CoA ligase family protein [Salinarimonas chemoclinalis]|uniref:phenylacetate--CoA ligase family protein n=1 Tax=Salinarimonas chemoclinalis TaxID=3241599 RepID=UPI003557A4D4